MCFFPAGLPAPSARLSSSLPALKSADWSQWRQQAAIPERTPFLISPTFEFDVDLNGFFLSGEMLGRARNTQDGYARDVRAFLNFLWCNRKQTSWRDVTAADHVAYLVWRRTDPDGPRIDDSTWDREVTAVNQFYAWQVRAQNVPANPIPQRARRPASHVARRSGNEPMTTAATYSHGAGRDKIEWIPPASYRRWRDVGVRGYTPQGLLDVSFRGRWAARNALFSDVMVRTGLRLSEQTALTVFEMPLDRGLGGYQRFWLPASIAKGSSARWVYVPESLVSEAITYAVIDRPDVIKAAQTSGRYRRWQRAFIVEDPDRPVARSSEGSRIKVAHLDPDERRRLLIDGPGGLAPAAFWLTESGDPVSRSGWKEIFRAANLRCRSAGVDLWVHPHSLRHSFAVVTLEQLQRGHIANLADQNPDQRRTYSMIFGDPLDWVRRRLGHRSVVTTQIYLHALAELEMETRMGLVPDDWDDPRETPIDELQDEHGGTAGVPT